MWNRKVTERREAGTPTFTDVKEQLRTHLAESLAMERYVARLRASTYVDIRAN